VPLTRHGRVKAPRAVEIIRETPPPLPGKQAVRI
jgi:hypothetical protein